MNHEFFMRRCLEIAALGLADAAPNPCVGALLVHDNVILSEAYTSAYGGPHAEVNCIRNVKETQQHLIASSTLYVSLEPCSHQGKTPPCSDLIIKHKIPLVVIANSDPNALVAGKGIAKLEAAGIKVILGILEKESLEVNKRFFTFHNKKRPYIILKWAQTANGFFAPDNNSQFWITNKKTKALVHSWRSQEMAILVGEKTILSDNPRLDTRLVIGKNPLRIVVNTQHHLNEELHIFQDGNPTLVFSFEKRANFAQVSFVLLNSHISVIKQIMDTLYNLQINSVIIEGGAFTLNKFIEENLWDEARILNGAKELHSGIVAPKINATLIDSFSILEDKIEIYRNKV
ncbi:MAG: bifunctional diaminohydroxyphosphoribosylaminopyrimidine deaminase/5-amino-6-(5-phosphoribosylamino)uracil reductase RibD [Candidatus Paceibacterota bacterium]